MFSIGRCYQRWEGGSPGEICSSVAEEVLSDLDECANRIGIGRRLGRIVGGLAEGESLIEKAVESAVENLVFGEVKATK
ncbi:MAG: hypothetical protein M3494_10260 [Actinomycetota bacterium]|jgi:hypothetical protein|nr:hypothetical protein [Rubrobacter sp.]MDQ3508383.1 hypothetical protein [Actinomycetota bacterium]